MSGCASAYDGLVSASGVAAADSAAADAEDVASGRGREDSVSARFAAGVPRPLLLTVNSAVATIPTDAITSRTSASERFCGWFWRMGQLSAFSFQPSAFSL